MAAPHLNCIEVILKSLPFNTFIRAHLQVGINLDTAMNGFGGEDFGYMMSVEVVPEVKVWSGSVIIFRVLGTLGAVVDESTADVKVTYKHTVYYVSKTGRHCPVHILILIPFGGYMPKGANHFFAEWKSITVQSISWHPTSNPYINIKILKFLLSDFLKSFQRKHGLPLIPSHSSGEIPLIRPKL